MADNYQISVGVKADFSDMTAALAEAKEALKSAQAQWESAYEALGKAAEKGSQQAISALSEYSAALVKAQARVAEIMAQQQASAAVAKEAADAQKAAAKAAAEAQRTLANQTRIAAEEARAMSGSMIGLARISADFGTRMLGLGPIAEMAFPVIGALALADMLGQLIGSVVDFSSRASDLATRLNENWLDGAVGQLDGLAKKLKEVDADTLQFQSDIDRSVSQRTQISFQTIGMKEGKSAEDTSRSMALQQETDGLKAQLPLLREKLDVLKQLEQRPSTNDSPLIDQFIDFGPDEKARSFDIDPKTVTGTAAAVEADSTQKEIESFQQRIALNEQMMTKLALDASQAGTPKTKAASSTHTNEGHTEMLADETALADQKREHAMSLQDEHDFWAKRLSAFRHGTEQYLAVENRMNALSEQIQRQNQQVKDRLAAQSVQAAREHQRLVEDQNRQLAASAAQTQRQMLQDAQGQARAAQTQIDASAKVAEARVNYQLATGAIKDQAAASEIAQIHAKKYADELRSLNDELLALEQLAAQGINTTVQQQTVRNQITSKQSDAQATSFQDATNAAQQKPSNTPAVEWANAWKNSQASVTQGFSDSMAQWLLVSDGYNTQFSVLMGRMMLGVAEQFASSLIKMGVDYAAHEAEKVVVHLASEAEQTAATAAGTAERIAIGTYHLGIVIAQDTAKLAMHLVTETAHTAAVIAGAAVRLAVEIASVMKTIAMYAASAAVKAWDALASIPVVGPALGAAAAGAVFAGALAFAGAFEQGGIIPGSVGSAVPILGHAGEAVLPQPLTAMLTTAASNGGGAGVHYHDHTTVSALDGPSVAGMMRAHGRMARAEFGRQMRVANHL